MATCSPQYGNYAKVSIQVASRDHANLPRKFVRFENNDIEAFTSKSRGGVTARRPTTDDENLAFARLDRDKLRGNGDL